MNNSRPTILGVRYKAKLPQGWSYPVGAQILTDILGDVADLAPNPLVFRHSKQCFTFKDRKRLGIRDTLPPVIQVGRYIALPGEEVQTDRLRWEILIGSVPSELRESVRICLLSEGLPRIKKWLTQDFTPVALDAGPSCQLSVREDSMVMVWETRSSRFADFRTETLSCLLARARPADTA